jgi:molybdate transport system substrate-binding protein
VVGPFPAELQQEVIFTSAAAANAREAEVAKEFITYFDDARRCRRYQGQGMDPG